LRPGGIGTLTSLTISPACNELVKKSTMNSSIGMAGIVSRRMLPRAESTAETRAIATLSLASTTLTKS